MERRETGLSVRADYTWCCDHHHNAEDAQELGTFMPLRGEVEVCGADDFSLELQEKTNFCNSTWNQVSLKEIIHLMKQDETAGEQTQD